MTEKPYSTYPRSGEFTVLSGQADGFTPLRRRLRWERLFRLVIIEAATGRQTAIRYPALPAVRMNDTPMQGNRVWWGADSKAAYFVDVERGEKVVHVAAVDALSGDVHELFSERSDT